MRRNRVRDGIVYLQVTRGVARRDHAFPAPGTAPSIVVTARAHDNVKAEKVAADGIAVITLADNRWARPDIKSVSLLPNILAKQAARDAGAREAWFIDAKGFVTEGASSNAWIVTADGEVVTRPVDNSILNGISRAVVLDAIAAKGLRLDGKTVHRRGSKDGAGGVRYGGEPDRATGDPHRRKAGRRRPPGPGCYRIAARIPPSCGIYLTFRRGIRSKSSYWGWGGLAPDRKPTF